MDIILDSNIYHSDPTFRGTEFPVLFDYLRVTKSRLIIPLLVRDEVVERYRDRLNEAVAKFNGLILEDLNVNVDGQVAALSHRMENPMEGVTVLIVDIVDKVSVRDIAEYGIKRRKPANNNGEQLRDVIIWLFTLQHAQQSASPVVLISRDSDFHRSKDQKILHPDLQAEIDRLKLTPTLSFYPDLGSFLSAVTTWRDLSEATWSQISASIDLFAQVKKRLEETLNGPAYRIEQAEVRMLRFEKGYEHIVNSDSSYLEAFYRGEALLFLTDLIGGHPHNTILEEDIWIDGRILLR
jgi:hypothetical protein